MDIDSERCAGPPPAVAVRELSRRFGDFIAVDRVSFDVAEGEVFGLIGPNGSGKTTLMKMLTTLLPPSGGSARVAGFDIAVRPAEVRQRIGYVPQLLSADRELTGYENLLVSARLNGLPHAETEPRIAEALAMMGLSEMRDRRVQAYSGGMIRRLEIAQSTLHRPRVIFMDEPTVGLDPSGRRAVWAHVRALGDRFGATIVMTTHQMDEADALCDRIGVRCGGHLVALGTPAELKARVGAGATLDDVFEALAGATSAVQGDYRGTRRERHGVSEHG